MAKYVLDDYTFYSKEEKAAALKEKEAIEYLNGHTEDGNVVVMTRLYNKLLDQNTFVTRLGIDYLTSLRAKIISLNAMADENLRPVPSPKSFEVERQEENAQRNVLVQRRKIGNLNNKLNIYRAAVIVMAGIIIAMFIIVLVGKYNPFTDYEEQLQDKYGSWHDSLNDKEVKLGKQEAELRNREIKAEDKETELNAYKDELEKLNETLKSKENELNDYENELKAWENDLMERENRFNEE